MVGEDEGCGKWRGLRGKGKEEKRTRGREGRKGDRYSLYSSFFDRVNKYLFTEEGAFDLYI